MSQPATSGNTPPVQRRWLPLIAVWSVVVVPAIWGVGQVVIKSLALFR